jgi:hypothetical protein
MTPFARRLAAVALFASSTAFALPPIPKYLPSALADNPDAKAYLEAVANAKDKCASCHTPGADKKGKGHGLNDFGKVIHKNFNDKEFKTAVKEKDEEKATEILKAAWAKSVDQKNADGKTFAELVKEGKLPGKNE